jgi:hypothetical protein
MASAVSIVRQFEHTSGEFDMRAGTDNLARESPLSRSAELERVRSSLPVEWQCWVFENILAGFDAPVIAEVLVRNGISAERLGDEIEVIRANPFAKVAMQMAQRTRKLDSWLAIRQLTRLSDSRNNSIERRSRLSRADFLREYYAGNKPVIVTGLLDSSHAMHRWTPEYLSEACGGAIVEVMSGRDTDADYEVQSTLHRTKMRFSDYIKQILGSGPSNNFYLVANNAFFDRPDMAVLRREAPTIPQYLDPKTSSRRLFFWFGPAGTVTPLHHDIMNVLVAQIRGRKRFTLISPEQIPWLYNHVGVYSRIDYEAADYERYPLFRNVKAISVELEPGETLFIPVGWWHHVRSLDLSMTITFTNFVFPNDYEWAAPTLD